MTESYEIQLEAFLFLLEHDIWMRVEESLEQKVGLRGSSKVRKACLLFTYHYMSTFFYFSPQNNSLINI